MNQSVFHGMSAKGLVHAAQFVNEKVDGKKCYSPVI